MAVAVLRQRLRALQPVGGGEIGSGRRGGWRGLRRGAWAAASSTGARGVAAPDPAQRLVGQRVRREIARDGEKLAAARFLVALGRLLGDAEPRERDVAGARRRGLGQARVGWSAALAWSPSIQRQSAIRNGAICAGRPCPVRQLLEVVARAAAVAVVELALRQHEQRPVLAAQILRGGGAQDRARRRDSRRARYAANPRPSSATAGDEGVVAALLVAIGCAASSASIRPITRGTLHHATVPRTRPMRSRFSGPLIGAQRDRRRSPWEA